MAILFEERVLESDFGRDSLIRIRFDHLKEQVFGESRCFLKILHVWSHVANAIFEKDILSRQARKKVTTSK